MDANTNDSGGQPPRASDFLAECTDGAALERLFKPGASMAEVAAYVLAQRVQQLSKELNESRERENNAASLITVIAGQRDDYSAQLRQACKQRDVELARAEKAETLCARYALFCDNVGEQSSNYGVVDPDLFSLGRRYMETAGKEGREFIPDDIPATDRAERAHKRRLIRQMAERAGISLGRANKD
jgi:hypothetical protein